MNKDIEIESIQQKIVKGQEISDKLQTVKKEKKDIEKLKHFFESPHTQRIRETGLPLCVKVGYSWTPPGGEEFTISIDKGHRGIIFGFFLDFLGMRVAQLETELKELFGESEGVKV